MCNLIKTRVVAIFWKKKNCLAINNEKTVIRIEEHAHTQWQSENESLDDSGNRWAVRAKERGKESPTPKNDNDFKFSQYWRIYVLVRRHFYFYYEHFISCAFIILRFCHINERRFMQSKNRSLKKSRIEINFVPKLA